MNRRAANERIVIDSGGAAAISGLLQSPPDARACYVFAHGAGAGMTDPFMAGLAEALAQRGIATLRFQFPYMERGSKRPDPPRIAHAAVGAAVLKAAQLVPDLPLIAGGKSFGGRMTSQAQALSPLPRVRGIVFLSFPLHLAGKPSDERARHLFDVKVPMLFIQGDRDPLAKLPLLEPMIELLGSRATLHLLPGAGHAYPPSSGLADVVTQWVEEASR